jgi:hypothetical protein
LIQEIEIECIIMNRFLIFMALLVILISFKGTSWAEGRQNFDIVMHGDAFFTSGIVSQSNDVSARSLEFMNRFRLKIIPTVVADNGVTYGAAMRLRASQRSGMIDADLAYIFTQGTFGTVELGTQLNPSMYYHVIAPNNFGTGGLDGDWAVGEVGWIQNQVTFLEPYAGGGYTVTTFMKEANRINYLTPRFFSDGTAQSGLMGTVSYTPVNRTIFSNVKRTTLNLDPQTNRPIGYGRSAAFSNCLGGTEPVGCNYHDIYELGLRYEQAIRDFTLRVGLTRAGGSTGRTNFGEPQTYHDLSLWQGGLQLGFGGVLIGGSYTNAGRSSYPHQSKATGRLYQDDQFTWTAGISYELGPIIVGANYQHGHDAGDLTVPGARTANLYAAGLTYWLAPGLSSAIEYMRSTTRNESGFTRDPLGFPESSSGNAHLFLWKTSILF